MVIIYIVVLILLWILFGIIGFCIETKFEGYTEEDLIRAKAEFKYCMVLGPISIIIFCLIIIYKKINDNFILFLIKKINKEKE